MREDLLIKPGQKARLHDRDPRDTLGLPDKDVTKAALAGLHDRLFELQARFRAEAKHGFLVILQAIDAGGKDGTIRSVFTGVNPQGVRVVSWNVPNDVEQAHDYLWRIHMQMPAKGEIVIFNRSHYEDVLVVRVNQLVAEARWRKRYRHINEFERMLTDEGTVIVKIHLQISKDEQRQRFEERLADPMKRWKFRRADLETREHWDDYMAAYEDVLTETSTAWAPWYVVPGDREWVRNTAVAHLLIRAIEDLKPAFPPGEPGLENLKIT